MDKNMEKVLAALSTITNKVTSIEKKITTIENNQNQFSNKMTTLEKHQIELSNRMSAFEKNQESFSLVLKSLDDKVDNLKVSLVDDLEPYLGNIEKHIDDSYNKLSSKIDDNYNDLSPKIKSQESAIKVLSSRSIQQEADTDTLNKIVRNQ